MSPPSIPKVKLNNGLEIPILGLGTWKSRPGEVTQVVKDAIDVGYRHIDCAYVYQNEKEIGEGLKAKLADKTVKREDLWITSKLWHTYHEPSLVEKNLRMTLSDLGLDYLDLYLVHWPQGFKASSEIFPMDAQGNILYSDVDYVDTWKAMEDLVKNGLVRSIGISNFNHEQVERLLKSAKIKPVTNQIECHPYLTQKKLSEFCKEREIVVTAYSPFASPDRPWARPDDPLLMEEPEIKEIAEKYEKTPAQVLIRYQIERGNVTIPKTVSKKRLQENMNVFDFKLDSDDLNVIDSFERNGRVCIDTRQENHKYYPFNIEY